MGFISLTLLRRAIGGRLPLFLEYRRATPQINAQTGQTMIKGMNFSKKGGPKTTPEAFTVTCLISFRRCPAQ
jgi:hypothetical protein